MKIGIVVFENDRRHLFRFHAVLVRPFSREDSVGVEIIAIQEEPAPAHDLRKSINNRDRCLRRLRFSIRSHRNSRLRRLESGRRADISRNRGCRHHRRRGKIDQSIAITHPTLEIPIRRGNAHLAGFDRAAPKPNTGPTTRRKLNRTCINERLPMPVACGALLNVGAGRR